MTDAEDVRLEMQPLLVVENDYFGRCMAWLAYLFLVFYYMLPVALCLVVLTIFAYLVFGTK